MNRLTASSVIRNIRTISKLIHTLLKYNRIYVAKIVGCILTVSLIGFFMPLIVQKLIDNGLIKENLTATLKYCGILSGLYLISGLLHIIMEKNRTILYKSVRLNLEKEMAEHLSVMDPRYYFDKGSASIYSVLQDDIEVICSIADAETFSFLTSFLTAVFGIVSLSVISWRLSITVIAIIIIQLLIGACFTNKTSGYAKELRKHFIRKNSLFNALIDGYREIRIFNLTNLYKNNIDDASGEFLDQMGNISVMSTVSTQIQSAVVNIYTLLIYVLACIMLIKQSITVGGIVAFQTYSLMTLNPIIAGIQIIVESSTVAEAYEHYNSFQKFPCEKSGDIIDVKNGDLMLTNVSFCYQNKTKIFDRVNCIFESGTKNAIVGTNGIGKTTLINLILRFLQPCSGEILLNGQKINDFSLPCYRSMFSVVDQKIYLFNASIRENICLNKKIDDKTFDDIIAMTNLTELIEEKGEDYIVGDNGSLISGGQKQKIAIARAIAMNTPFLILDEATSNLDKETVDIINNVIKNNNGHKTIICVTHGNLDLDNFDYVYEINDLSIERKSI